MRVLSQATQSVAQAFLHEEASFAAEFGFFNGLENFANGTLGSWRIRNILIEKRQKALTAQNCGDSI